MFLFEKHGIEFEVWVRMDHLQRDEATKGEWNMKLTKKAVEGQCRAMRCQEPPVQGHEGVLLCERHAAEHNSPQKITVTMNSHSDWNDSTPFPIVSAQSAAEAAEERATEYLDLVDGFAIESQEDLELAADILRDVKTAWKEIEEQRRSITKPLDDAKKAAQALFKPALDALDEVEVEVKKLIAQHREREEAHNRTAMTEGNKSAITTLRELAGVSTSKVWAFEVTDPSEVARELCSPDSAKIRAYMALAVAADVAPEAPGIRFFQETRVASRS